MKEIRMKKIKGFKFMQKAPKDKPIVEMITFNGTIYMATAESVYYLKDGVFIPISMLMQE